LVSAELILFFIVYFSSVPAISWHYSFKWSAKRHISTPLLQYEGFWYFYTPLHIYCNRQWFSPIHTVLIYHLADSSEWPALGLNIISWILKWAKKRGKS
jgi:hypothetical protein